MLRRDLLTAEIQKLAQALARIMGLKQSHKLDDAEKEIDDLLEHEFGILYSDLLAVDETDFASFLREKNFQADKLDIFSQLLFLKFTAPMVDNENKSVAAKLLMVYNLLEKEHHVINMINIGRQKRIEQYLKELNGNP